MSIEENTDKNKAMHHLSQMGWTAFFQAQLEPVANDGVMPARVVGVLSLIHISEPTRLQV